MISVKEAAHIAVKYLGELVPMQGGAIVEEVYKTNNSWVITLSYIAPPAGTQIYGFGPPDREYKVFEIDGDNGDVISMKIRGVRPQ